MKLVYMARACITSSNILDEIIDLSNLQVENLFYKCSIEYTPLKGEILPRMWVWGVR